jgi:hypothetical protein
MKISDSRFIPFLDVVSQVNFDKHGVDIGAYYWLLNDFSEAINDGRTITIEDANGNKDEYDIIDGEVPDNIYDLTLELNNKKDYSKVTRKFLITEITGEKVNNLRVYNLSTSDEKFKISLKSI